MSEWVYLHTWPILDNELPLSALTAEAAMLLDAVAAVDGAYLYPDHPPRWRVSGDRLVVEAAARPATPAEVRRAVGATVARLRSHGWSAAEVTLALGADPVVRDVMGT